MKILLANNHLVNPGGTETWTLTMAKELAKEHEVGVFTLHKGVVAESVKELLDDHPKGYDLALINHHTCLSALKDADIGVKVFTSHGIIPSLEQPVAGADFYVGVSEEVQANLASKGFDSEVIRNPIDTGKFYPTELGILRQVLFLSNYQGEALPIAEEATRQLGLRLDVVGKDKPANNIAERINAAQLVIGLGRSAYEAMSCNRNVIVYDYNGADGFATPESLLEFRKNNCSGRRYKKVYTIEDLKLELLKYNPTLPLRDYILENNNVEVIAKEYLCYIDKSK